MAVARTNSLPHPTRLVHAVVIVSVVTIIYLNSLTGVFLFDDDSAIVNNLSIRDLWSLDWFQLRGRPVTTLTLAINYALGGLDPIGYHIVNVAIHIANSLLLYRLIVVAVTRRYGRSSDSYASRSTCYHTTRDFAFASTMLWAAHPLCTQSVTYTIQRSEALVALGLLATLLCWTYATSRSINLKSSRCWFFGAFLAAVFAYGSKESAAFLPIITLLYDRIFLAESWRSMKARAVWHFVIALPVLVGIGVYAWAFLSGVHQDQTVGFAMGRINTWSYLASQPMVFVQYLLLAAMPISQSLDYGWLPSNSPSHIAIGLILWLGIIVVTVWSLRRQPPVGFLIAASFLVLAPSSSLMPLQDIIFEHRMYLPLAAVCIIAVVIWGRVVTLIGSRFTIPINRLSTIVGIGVLVALGSLTVARNRDYHSRERMFESDASRNPENPRAWTNLAAERNFENADDCIAMNVKALRLYEDRGYFYAGTRYKLTRAIGDIYFLTGRPDDAYRFFSQSLECANDALQAAEIHFSMAMIESARGQIAESDHHFRSAVALSDTIPGLHEAFAVHLRRSGREQLAVAEEKTAIEQSRAGRRNSRAKN